MQQASGGFGGEGGKFHFSVLTLVTWVDLL